MAIEASSANPVSPSWLERLWGLFLEALAFPINPNERIFLPYLLVSALLAYGVYSGMRRAPRRKEAPASFWRFLFPREVWATSSAWLDVRYFFFHQPVRLLIVPPLIAISAGAFHHATLHSLTGKVPEAPLSEEAVGVWVAFAFSTVSTLVVDFVAYAMHRAQHRVPILWEFHKVHHSLTVMHPLSNYREHPIDDAFYAVGTGAVVGLLFTLWVALAGYLPSGMTVFGAGIYTVPFYAIGYNLRHSHVWLRWRPEVLNRVFGCPAHHQVHHSCHPDHVDKNFGFLFSLWDVLLGTYCLPKSNEDVRFGLGTGEEPEYRSCLLLYVLPFRKLLGSRGGRAQTSQLEAPASRR